MAIPLPDNLTSEERARMMLGSRDTIQAPVAAAADPLPTTEEIVARMMESPIELGDFSGVNMDKLNLLSEITSPDFKDKYEFRQTDREKMLGLPGKLYVKGTEELAPENIRRGMLEVQFSLQSGGADLRGGTADEIEAKMEADAAAAYDRARAKQEKNPLKALAKDPVSRGVMDIALTAATGSPEAATAITTALAGGDLEDVAKNVATTFAIRKGTEYASKAFAPSEAATTAAEEAKDAAEVAVIDAKREAVAKGNTLTAAQEAEIYQKAFDKTKSEVLEELSSRPDGITSGAARPTGVETLTTTGEALSLPVSGGISSIPTEIIAPTAAATTGFLNVGDDFTDVQMDEKIRREGEALKVTAERPAFSASGEPIFDPSAISPLINPTAGILDESLRADMDEKIKREADVVVEAARPDASVVEQDVLSSMDGVTSVVDDFVTDVETGIQEDFADPDLIDTTEEILDETPFTTKLAAKGERLKEAAAALGITEDRLKKLFGAAAIGAGGIAGINALTGGSRPTDQYASFRQQVADRTPTFTGFAPVGTAPARVGRGGVRQFSAGGLNDLAPFQARGQISGPGTGTSDSIPAYLSDGEFVMTAKAVRGAGNGDRDKGAANMYDMMAKFESMA